MKHYEQYQTFQLSRPDAGILEIAMGEDDRLGVADAAALGTAAV